MKLLGRLPEMAAVQPGLPMQDGSSGSIFSESFVSGAPTRRWLTTCSAAETGRVVRFASVPGFPPGTTDDVDDVVVDENRPNVELVAKEERHKKAIVDDDVPRDPFDSGGSHGASQFGVTGERIRFGQDGVAQAVGFVMIPVADGDGAVGIRAAAHRQIAGSDHDQIAVQALRWRRPCRCDRPAYRRCDPVRPH